MSGPIFVFLIADMMCFHDIMPVEIGTLMWK